VLLYELLTGELPFKAAHEAAVMYEIVNVNPPGISSVRPDVEPELERIVMKCLEKDREDRYQSVKDVAVDLKHFKRDSEGRRIERRTPQPDVRGQVSQPSEEIRPIHPGRMPRWMKVAVPAVLVVAVAVVVLLLLRPSAKVSDEWVFRPLQLPFTTVGYPGLSADGNWIAFPATDANNVTEIYYMHASGGDPRKLTNDSLWKYTADISPDGSQIVYTRGSSRRELSFPLQILTISTLGGGSTRIAEAGNGPRWSPDGSSIAYIARGPMQGIGLWVMNSDGRNKRLVLEDSLGGRVSLAWSPDGKSIAWLRSFRGEADVYQEIIIRDLESGKERQLTFDKKNIDEVYWMPQGEIIFSSNRNGPSNLWAISSSGGTPLQITKGPGPDLGIKASRDGKRILYLQQSTFGSIWVGDLQGMFSRQITPDDQTVVSAAFSPDGRQIAYVVDDPDPIKQRRYFYLVDLGSRSRRQLTMEGERVEDFVWSPDGRKVAYTIHVSSEIDSMHNVAIFDVSEPSKKISVGNGRVIGWLRDGVSLNVVWNQTSWRVPMSGGTTERLFEDSTVVFPSPDGTKLAIIDSRHDRRGLWIKTKDKESKRFLDRPLAGGGRWLSDSKRFAFPHGDEIWILSIETGKIQPYPWKNPEAVSPSDLSQDGAQTVFVKQRMNAKLILIDNFH
jgi:Tol biopolymer transport system component